MKMSPLHLLFTALISGILFTGTMGAPASAFSGSKALGHGVSADVESPLLFDRGGRGGGGRSAGRGGLGGGRSMRSAGHHDYAYGFGILGALSIYDTNCYGDMSISYEECR